MMRAIRIAVCSVKRNWHAHLCEVYRWETGMWYRKRKEAECVFCYRRSLWYKLKAIDAELQRRKLKEG